jgi:hypothetical protein
MRKPQIKFKPTPLSQAEFESWFVRLRFKSYARAAECLNCQVDQVRRWMNGMARAPAMIRQTCRYIERFGKWDQISDYPREHFEAWLASLPASKDDIARAAHRERMVGYHRRLKRNAADPGKDPAYAADQAPTQESV